MRDESYSQPLYPDAQLAVLELLPLATAPLSIVGSLLILRFIWCNHVESLKSVYHRIMLGISVSDLLGSLGVSVLGPWVVPSEVEFTTFGTGSWGTCEAAAFMTNFLFCTMWYSGFLSLYFLLVVRYEYEDEVLAKHAEPFAHVISLGYGLASGIYGVAANLFSPVRELPGFCWFHDYPPYCSSKKGTPDCEREGHNVYLSFVGNVVTVVFIFVTIFLSMILIVLKVRKTEIQMRQYAVGSENSSLMLTQETGRRGILYIGSYFVTYFPVFALDVLRDMRQDPDHRSAIVFVFALLSKFLTPMQVRLVERPIKIISVKGSNIWRRQQGFFNAYIFLHKKFWKLTREGECFGFMRKIPVIGNWILNLSEKYCSQ